MRPLIPAIRVIVTSGFNRQGAVNRFTGKGRAGFLPKPFELSTLTQVIRRVQPHG